MGSSVEVKKTIRDWFYGLLANFFDAGVQKLGTQYNICILMGIM
jgi:hypothetical protein